MIMFVKRKESRIQSNFPTIGPNLYELCNNCSSSLSAFSEILSSLITKPEDSSRMFKNLVCTV